MTKDLKDYKDAFEQYLTDFSWPDDPAALYDPMAYIVKLGGKRIRPILTLMICELYSGDFKNALDAAMAIELFHNFSLIHDDIMDEALLRRGSPAVHRKYNTNQAILSGDVMLIQAYNMLSQIDDAHLQFRLYKIFNKTAIDVCEGQQLDIDFETDINVSEDMYLKMIGKKTASLLATAMQIGAVIGGLDQDRAQLLYDFGYQLGLAFQIQDDWLDVYGNRASFGKMDAGDILQNKKTILFIKARDAANASDRSRLNALYSSEQAPEDKVTLVKKIFQNYNIKEYVQQKMNSLYENALNQLDEMDLQQDQKDTLLSLAELIVKRSN